MVENVFNPLNSDDKNLGQKKTFITVFFGVVQFSLNQDL